ncbi:MAG: DUF3592 domain-containing protein [Clostridia bacterium]|nr:DUF3592 domain-containing protein [Clostridia bacterium]
MGAENKIARFMQGSRALRFLLPLSLILIALGVILLFFNAATANYVETTATVTGVVEIDTTDITEYETSFTFSVGGTNYTGSFSINERKNIGDTITVYYNPDNPSEVTNSKDNLLFAIISLVLGGGLLVLSIVITVRNFSKYKKLDNQVLDDAVLEEYRNRPLSEEEVEYYCSLSGPMLKPGYLVEDKNRRPVFEAINTKNVPVVPREFQFVNHYSGKTTTHKVTRPADVGDNSVFSTTSTIKFDGVNIWDYLHKAGIRIKTDLTSILPRIRYTILLAGEQIARVETSSKYVHEEDEENKTIKIPVERYYYRIWTRELDLDLLFLAVFAISETNQTVVE